MFAITPNEAQIKAKVSKEGIVNLLGGDSLITCKDEAEGQRLAVNFLITGNYLLWRVISPSQAELIGERRVSLSDYFKTLLELKEKGGTCQVNGLSFYHPSEKDYEEELLHRSVKNKEKEIIKLEKKKEINEKMLTLAKELEAIE